jgi:hypothetical protein
MTVHPADGTARDLAEGLKVPLREREQAAGRNSGIEEFSDTEQLTAGVTGRRRVPCG